MDLSSEVPKREFASFTKNNSNITIRNDILVYNNKRRVNVNTLNIKVWKKHLKSNKKRQQITKEETCH